MTEFGVYGIGFIYAAAHKIMWTLETFLEIQYRHEDNEFTQVQVSMFGYELRSQILLRLQCRRFV